MRQLTGYHSIEEALRVSGAGGTLSVSRRSKRVDRLVSAARRVGARVERVSDSELTNMSGNPDHRGAVLRLPEAEAAPETDFGSFLRKAHGETSLVLVLDGITDPHNLGAVLRSADQFAVDLVVLPERRSASVGATVAKTSAGASAFVPYVVVPNLVRAVTGLQEAGFWAYGADVTGGGAHSSSLTGRVCLVLGSEGGGLSRLVGETCDALVRIPTAGHVESLNVSVAAGILMYEVRRQQGLVAAWCEPEARRPTGSG